MQWWVSITLVNFDVTPHPAGQYLCIELEDVPLLVAERLRQYGFLLAYALYAHEQKLSVLHFHVQKYGAYTEPLKSKDEVLFMVSGHPRALPLLCAAA
jgi:hypothetical protein